MRAAHENLVLAAVPERERHLVARFMEPVEYACGEIVYSDATAGTIYFPVTGLVSITTNMADGTTVECAACSNEGWVGAELFHGVDCGNITALQQVAGSGLRMRSADLETARRESPAFADALTRFGGLLLRSALQAGACSRLHDAISRCARWLLFCADRLGRQEFPLTQEFLAEMLGASRSAVGLTMQKLEADGLVTRKRGHIVIYDAAALRRTACECYEVMRAIHERYNAQIEAVR